MDVDDMSDADLEAARKVLRRLLGHPEPESVPGPNIVPQEGRTTGTPGISDEQYRLDFLRRLNGTIPAYAEQLPEPDKD
jgi:hypothetical protein